MYLFLADMHMQAHCRVIDADDSLAFLILSTATPRVTTRPIHAASATLTLPGEGWEGRRTTLAVTLTAQHGDRHTTLAAARRAGRPPPRLSALYAPAIAPAAVRRAG